MEDDDQRRILKLENRLKESQLKNSVLRDQMKDMQLTVNKAIEDSSRRIKEVQEEKRL